MSKKHFLGILVALLVPAALMAAVVTASEYIKAYGLYGRSDGLFQRTDSHGFDLHVNGYRLESVGKAVYEDFSEYGDGENACMQMDYTACSGTAGDYNALYMPSGNIIASVPIVAQTITGCADMDAGSLDIAGDQNNNDGCEYVMGVPGTSGAPFIIGRDPAFYTCARLGIEDVSGTDDMLIGFRRLEAHTAAVDDYNDMAAINIISGDICIETIDDNNATTSTDTTLSWADAAIKTVCVYVSAAGVVTYKINGQAPPTTAAFTWDDADPVIPFIYLLQAADLSGEIDLYEWEVGYQ